MCGNFIPVYPWGLSSWGLRVSWRISFLKSWVIIINFKLVITRYRYSDETTYLQWDPIKYLQFVKFLTSDFNFQVIWVQVLFKSFNLLKSKIQFSLKHSKLIINKILANHEASKFYCHFIFKTFSFTAQAVTNFSLFYWYIFPDNFNIPPNQSQNDLFYI